MTILGKEVLEIMPEFTTPPSIIGRRDAEIASLSHSKRRAQFVGKHAVHTLNHSFRFISAAEIRAFSDFWETVAGRWGAFWVPSWHSEINPVEGMVNGTNLLAITPVGYAGVYLADTELTRLGRYIWMFKPDGTTHVSKVTAASVGNPEVLTLETAVAEDWDLGTFEVGFLYHVRFASDRLSLDFSGATEASARVAMVETIKVESLDDIPPVEESEPAPVTPEAWTDNQGAPFTTGPDGEDWTVN